MYHNSKSGNAVSKAEGVENHQFRALIIDDDEKFSHLLGDYLLPFGFDLREAHDGMAGLRMLSEDQFDVVILDLMLPGMDGLEILRRLGPNRRIPVLMLTARGEEPDRIVGLEMGADDYLPKTASPREILARLRAITRRYQETRNPSATQAILDIGSLHIEESTRQATLHGNPLPLTSFEFDLLLALARSAGRIRTRDQLLQETASRPQNIFDRSIDVHISSLRRKLMDDARNPEFIVTVRNTGYMMRRQS
jgi:DNA-binding response OmpR family regulator